MSKKVLFFDIDGTLVESRLGIVDLSLIHISGINQSFKRDWFKYGLLKRNKFITRKYL